MRVECSLMERMDRLEFNQIGDAGACAIAAALKANKTVTLLE